MIVSRNGGKSIERALPADSLADAAYTEIRRRIIQCEMVPGWRMTEADLVGQIGAGKTPVREALGRLIRERLVRAIPRQGYEVSPITLRDAHEIFGLRLIIEPAAVELAADRIDVARLRRLDELCQAGYALDDHASASAFLRANTEFHMTIAGTSDNARLAKMLAQLLGESERLFHLSLMLRNRSDEMAHEHKDLVDALAAADTKAARRIAVEQILAAQRMVVDALLSSPVLLEAPVTAPRPQKVSA